MTLPAARPLGMRRADLDAGAGTVVARRALFAQLQRVGNGRRRAGVARRPFHGPCGRPVKRDATSSARPGAGTWHWRQRRMLPAAASSPCGDAGAMPTPSMTVPSPSWQVTQAPMAASCGIVGGAPS